LYNSWQNCINIQWECLNYFKALIVRTTCITKSLENACFPFTVFKKKNFLTLYSHEYLWHYWFSIQFKTFVKVTLTWQLHVQMYRCYYMYYRRGHDCMVVGITTTYVISAYHHQLCEFESSSGVLDKTLCDKVCQ
jgi:hypothetical protein